MYGFASSLCGLHTYSLSMPGSAGLHKTSYISYIIPNFVTCVYTKCWSECWMITKLLGFRSNITWCDIGWICLPACCFWVMDTNSPYIRKCIWLSSSCGTVWYSLSHSLSLILILLYSPFHLFSLKYIGFYFYIMNLNKLYVPSQEGCVCIYIYICVCVCIWRVHWQKQMIVFNNFQKSCFFILHSN